MLALPLLLIDADELLLLLNLGTRDILTWAVVAAVVTVVLHWLLGLGLYLLRPGLVHLSRPVRWGGTLAAWLVAGLLYFLVGQPGQ
jgi:hypothetical protein